MTPTAYVNGEITALEAAKISILDRSFLYGDSVYEVFCLYGGVPFMFDEHYERLLKSARLMHLDVPFSKDELLTAVKQTVLAAKPEADEHVYVRYQLTRGAGPVDLDPNKAGACNLVIIVKPLPVWSQRILEQGVRLMIPLTRRNPVDSIDPNIKGGNYLNNILGVAEAKAQGLDDALFLDHQGYLTECSNSNIWFVCDQHIVTPEKGCLRGLTKDKLKELWQAVSVSVTETEITIDQAKTATECFVTSSTRGVFPVASVQFNANETVNFPAGGGTLTRQAITLYQQMIDDLKADKTATRWW